MIICNFLLQMIKLGAGQTADDHVRALVEDFKKEKIFDILQECLTCIVSDGASVSCKNPFV